MGGEADAPVQGVDARIVVARGERRVRADRPRPDTERAIERDTDTAPSPAGMDEDRLDPKCVGAIAIVGNRCSGQDADRVAVGKGEIDAARLGRISEYLWGGEGWWRRLRTHGTEDARGGVIIGAGGAN